MERIKANATDLYKLGIDYHAFQRVRRADGTAGTLFVLDRPLTPGQRDALAKFRNVIFSECSLRYAPEIRYETVILTDKCINIQK